MAAMSKCALLGLRLTTLVNVSSVGALRLQAQQVQMVTPNVMNSEDLYSQSEVTPSMTGTPESEGFGSDTEEVVDQILEAPACGSASNCPLRHVPGGEAFLDGVNGQQGNAKAFVKAAAPIVQPLGTAAVNFASTAGPAIVEGAKATGRAALNATRSLRDDVVLPAGRGAWQGLEGPRQAVADAVDQVRDSKVGAATGAVRDAYVENVHPHVKYAVEWTWAKLCAAVFFLVALGGILGAKLWDCLSGRTATAMEDLE